MKTEEMIEYIRKTPKQYLTELPDKLQKWTRRQNAVQSFLEIGKQNLNPIVDFPDPNEQIRLEIATKILVRHAPAATINPESLADYCVEAADELLKRLKR